MNKSEDRLSEVEPERRKKANAPDDSPIERLTQLLGEFLAKRWLGRTGRRTRDTESGNQSTPRSENA